MLLQRIYVILFGIRCYMQFMLHFWGYVVTHNLCYISGDMLLHTIYGILLHLCFHPIFMFVGFLESLSTWYSGLRSGFLFLFSLLILSIG